MKTPRVQRTLLDTEPPPSDAERVDAEKDQHKARQQRLRNELVDMASVDEALRRELADKLKAIGQHKRGRVAPSVRRAYVEKLWDYGYSDDEIIKQLTNPEVFGISARQAVRDIERVTEQKAPAKR